MSVPSKTLIASPKPSWLRVHLPQGDNFRYIRDTLQELNLHTVCEEAHCPNLGECWGGGTATFMVMGDVCTRGCRFCAVKTGRQGTPLDPEEPSKIAQAVLGMKLDYIVITSVDRDDLPDQGAQHFANVIKEVKRQTNILIEVLIPDFRGNTDALTTIVNSSPDVVAHNLETVKSLTPYVRDRKASYEQSLNVLRYIKSVDPNIYTKSSLMLGVGESLSEVKEAFQDLRTQNVDFLTLGQYLRPSPKHLEVKRYLPPEEFEQLRVIALAQGFKYVASGPLVRSSYRAGEFYVRSLKEK